MSVSVNYFLSYPLKEKINLIVLKKIENFDITKKKSIPLLVKSITPCNYNKITNEMKCSVKSYFNSTKGNFISKLKLNGKEEGIYLPKDFLIYYYADWSKEDFWLKEYNYITFAPIDLLIIKPGKVLRIDINTQYINKLIVEGVLLIKEDVSKNIVLNVNHIVVRKNGKILIGNEFEQFKGNFTLSMNGDKNLLEIIENGSLKAFGKKLLNESSWIRINQEGEFEDLLRKINSSNFSIAMIPIGVSFNDSQKKSDKIHPSY